DGKLDNGDAAATPIPAAETPSKPKAKIRKLKTARTASTPAKVPVLSETKAEDADRSIDDAKPKALPKPRRSRIATPAKGLTNAALLPADLAPAPATGATKVENKVPAPRKRAATSRLLPPGTLASAPTTSAPAPIPTSTAMTVVEGKENASLASPPKKRSVAPVPKLSLGAKAGVPRLDFGKAADFRPTSRGVETEDLGVVGVPRLASPAKKGRRRAVIFGASVAAGMEGSGREADAPMLGLSSPAKKRSNRRVGI
ncbi:hypothetical protein LTR53_016238, partial [Teratosphaeriaceae sp. CCFEE 6253]